MERPPKKKGLWTRRKVDARIVSGAAFVLGARPRARLRCRCNDHVLFARAHRLPCNLGWGGGLITARNWPSGLSINFPFFLISFDLVMLARTGRNADRHVLNKRAPRQTRRARASREPRPRMREAARPAPHRWPVAAAAAAARSGVVLAALRLRPRPRRRSRRNSTTFLSHLRSSPRSHPTAVSRCACS